MSSSSSKFAFRKSVPPRVLPGVVTVTRQVHFNSAHRLFNPSKSHQWNLKHYGLCTNPNWHGHNYILEVSVRGTPDPQTAYLIDLGELKRLLHAARLLYQELAGDKRIGDFQVACSHLESLHSHDAVSVICKGVPGGLKADISDFQSLVC